MEEKGEEEEKGEVEEEEKGEEKGEEQLFMGITIQKQ